MHRRFEKPMVSEGAQIFIEGLRRALEISWTEILRKDWEKLIVTMYMAFKGHCF